MDNLRTWIEIDARAARKNYETFRKLIGPKVNLWAVVKSNAYGHGLFVFSRLMDRLGADGFCVDTLVEGLKLRTEGIKKPILVLGPTLPNLLRGAAAKNITLTVSNFDALTHLLREKRPPEFHIKVDTGMHRQGFYVEELAAVLRKIQMSPQRNQRFLTGQAKSSAKGGKCQNQLKGIYTHFAAAKDINYPTYTERQFTAFQNAVRLFARAGYKNLITHCAATGATLIDKRYHLDAVRLGIGLYGLWPSRELELQLAHIRLHPILAWKARISEVKTLARGAFVGYDLAERVRRQTNTAVIPIGYWHGFPRSLSSVGSVLIRGRRAKVLGRISMDLTSVALGGTGVKTGDPVTIIGRDGSEAISVEEHSEKSGTSNYELVTRLNPLMERVLVPRPHHSL